MKKAVARLLLALISFGAALLLTEGAFRYVTQRSYKHDFSTSSDTFQYDQSLEYTYKPNLKAALFSGRDFQMRITTTPLGFRTSSYRTPEKRKILLVGDSFTFGWGVDDDETYPAFMNKWKTHFPNLRNVEFVNVGAVGWGTANYKYAIQKFVDYYSTQNIEAVVIYHVSNDFWDNVRYFTAPTIQEESIMRRSPVVEMAPDKFGAWLHSDVVNYLRVKGFFLALRNKMLETSVRSSGDRILEGVRFSKDCLESKDKRPPSSECLESLRSLQRKLFSDILGFTGQRSIPVLSGFDKNEEWQKTVVPACVESRHCHVADIAPLLFNLPGRPDELNPKYINHHSGGHFSSEGNEKLARHLLGELDRIVKKS